MDKSQKVITTFFEKATKRFQTVNTITDKLDWLSNEYNALKKDTLFYSKFHNLHMVVEHLITPHFQDHETNPEFTYWFLKYNAAAMFKYHINQKEFKRQISSNEKKQFITDELKKIENEAIRARQLQTDQIINSSNNYKTENGFSYTFNKNIYSIEVKRILEGNFYSTHPTTHSYNQSTYEVIAYFKHKLLKVYLDKECKSITKPSKKSKDYSQKQVAIAYFFLNEPITEETYLSILKKHTKTTSNKILQKLIVKTNQLTSISGHKTSDTKHSRDLKKAKRLISGKKNKDAKNEISHVITTFEANYKNHYE